MKLNRWTAEFTFDMVRGTLSETGESAPDAAVPGHRRPALCPGRLSGGHGVNMVAAQDRVFGEELPTDGYATLRLFGSYSFTRGAVLNTLTARLENATNTLYQNHLNYLKDRIPEMGRNFKVYTRRVLAGLLPDRVRTRHVRAKGPLVEGIGGVRLDVEGELELGLKKDAGHRKDNLTPDEIRGPEVPAGPGRSPVIPAAEHDKAEVPPQPPSEPAEEPADPEEEF